MEKTGRRKGETGGNNRRGQTHRLGHIDIHKKETPAAERGRAHTSDTRISAIAHPSAESTLKSAPVIPTEPSKKPAIRAQCARPALSRTLSPQARRGSAGAVPQGHT